MPMARELGMRWKRIEEEQIVDIDNEPDVTLACCVNHVNNPRTGWVMQYQHITRTQFVEVLLADGANLMSPPCQRVERNPDSPGSVGDARFQRQDAQAVCLGTMNIVDHMTS